MSISLFQASISADLMLCRSLAYFHSCHVFVCTTVLSFKKMLFGCRCLLHLAVFFFFKWPPNISQTVQKGEQSPRKVGRIKESYAFYGNARVKLIILCDLDQQVVLQW